MKCLCVLSPRGGRTLAAATAMGPFVALAFGPTDDIFNGLDGTSCEQLRVSDPALASELLHPFDWEARAAVVAAQVARHVGASTVFVTQSRIGFLGAAMAEQLNLSHLGEVVSVHLEGDREPQLVIERRGLRGVQTLHGGQLGVLSFLPSSPVLPSPSPNEARRPVQHLSLEELSLFPTDLPDALLEVRDKTPRTRQPRLFLSADLLIERLRRDGLG